MRRPDLLIGLIFVIVFFNSIWLVDGSDQAFADGKMAHQLILSLYLDESGRCLVTGYVEDPSSLPFLNSSEYSYEDESRQLYAITNALTSKSADSWSVSFESEGIYDEYRLIFYLPANSKLSRVEPSQGLEYLVYAANNSVIAEVHGHDVSDPVIDIGYSLQLAETAAAKEDALNAANAGGDAGGFSLRPYLTVYLAVALLLLLLAGLWLFLNSYRRRSKSVGHGQGLAAYGILRDLLTSGSADSEHNIESHPARALDDDIDATSGMNECPVEFRQNKAGNAAVRACSEASISAVMATLTDKERSILKLLRQRGGRMLQRDISYETDISKSSLSGILTSMEKRKLINKREEGRTNIIELSEQFKNNIEQYQE